MRVYELELESQHNYIHCLIFMLFEYTPLINRTDWSAQLTEKDSNLDDLTMFYFHY